MHIRYMHLYYRTFQAAYAILQCYRCMSVSACVQHHSVVCEAYLLQFVVIQVLEPMPKSIGEVIRSYKSACTALYKKEFLSDDTFGRIFSERKSIWEHIASGYHERILHCEGQLDRMIRYVKDNPRRLWLKHSDYTYFLFRAAKLQYFSLTAKSLPVFLHKKSPKYYHQHLGRYVLTKPNLSNN